jgi:APA family basic amino acid/polyamine antiporter
MSVPTPESGSVERVAAVRGVFRRKPVQDILEDENTNLERSIGLWQLTAIGIGGIIGAGIFSLAGSAYTYGYVVLGEIVGWCIGWDLLLEYIAIVAVVAIGVSGYFRFLLNPRHRPAPVDAGSTRHG